MNRRGSDRGSVTILATSLVFLASLSALAVADIGAFVSARAQAVAAADAGALAGAIDLGIGAEPGEGARELAAANGAQLTSVDIDTASRTVTVEVSVVVELRMVGARRVGARARAVAPAGSVSASAAELVAHPGFSVYADGRSDLLAGQVDPRVIGYLYRIVRAGHEIHVSSLRTGHSKFVAGTSRVSNHWHGRAADISVVDGRPVSAENEAARAIYDMTASLVRDRPSEFGMPWTELAGHADGTTFFADPAHQGHLHIGWSAR